MTLKLQCWTNDLERTKEELEKMGNKILKVKKDKDANAHMHGFNCAYITYKHPTLMVRPEKGDLVEYYDWVRGRKTLKEGIVIGSDTNVGIIKDHVEIKQTIIAIGNITRIIQKQIIPKKLFKYL